mgnify:CR=1 FL=1
MQTKEITYFARSVERAEKRYNEYYSRTEAQSRNLGFVCAGNLKRSCRKRLNTITDKQIGLYSALALRRLFLKMYRLERTHDRIFWNQLNDICEPARVKHPHSIITIIVPSRGTTSRSTRNTRVYAISSRNTARPPIKNT